MSKFYESRGSGKKKKYDSYKMKNVNSLHTRVVLKFFVPVGFNNMFFSSDQGCRLSSTLCRLDGLPIWMHSNRVQSSAYLHIIAWSRSSSVIASSKLSIKCVKKIKASILLLEYEPRPSIALHIVQLIQKGLFQVITWPSGFRIFNTNLWSVVLAVI